MTTVPLAEARANLSRMVDEAVRTHERVEITRNGSRAAVLMSAEDYDSLEETLDVLSDPDLIADIRAALAEAHDGHYYTLDDVRAEMESAGRLRG
jgi:prevent-host-death family protein